MAQSRPGGIIRTPRDPYPGKVEQLERQPPYMHIPDRREEEQGEELSDDVEESSLENEGSDSNLSGDSRSESVDTFQDDDIEEQQLQNEDMTEFDIGNGVQIKTNQNIAEELQHYRAEKWNVDLKNSFSQAASLRSNTKFVTTLYKLFGKPKSTNITNPGERKLPKSKRCVFSLLEEYREQVWFRVQLDEDIMRMGEALSSTFSAWVECGNEWKTVKANFKDGHIQFSCCRLNSFAVVCRPKSMNNYVMPDGIKIYTAEGRTIAEFEPGTVDSAQNIQYKIKKPNLSNIQQLIESNSLVTGASDRIILEKCDKSKFKKQIKLFSGSMENGSDFDSSIEVVGFVDNKPVILPSKITQEKRKDEYQSLIDICDDAAFVKIRKKGQDNVKIIGSLKDEIDVAYGDKYLCKILLFYVKRINTTLYFEAECCFSKYADSFKQKHKQINHRFISESDNLFIPHHQRIRISPSRGITQTFLSGKKYYVFLFFMYLDSKNHVRFPVEICNRSECATLEFKADNRGRGVLTKTEFLLETFFRNKRPAYVRQQSTMSAHYRTQSARPSTTRPGLERRKTTLD